MFFSNGFPGFFDMGGQGAGESPETDKEVDNKQLYEILNLPNTATTEEIKKAYKQLARIHHPDKGGDPDKFKEIQASHEILTNKEKRETYDKYGMEGLKEGTGAGDPFADILGGLFGMPGGRRGGHGAQQKKKAKPTAKECKITLEDVYLGKLIKLPITRQKCCGTCDGKGGANAKKCAKCKGLGVVEKVVQLGPGFLSSTRQHCGDCKGEGVKMEKADICKTCKGDKIVQESKTLEVPVEQGVPDKHQQVFYGEGDEYPGIQAGDLVVIFTIESHKKFERKGADLYYKKKISLYEALTEISFVLEHLDGKKINITTKPGEIVTPGSVRQLSRKGLPFYKDAMSQGNLYIVFDVEFPKKGEMKNIDDLKKILPQPKNQEKIDKKTAEYLEDYDETSTNPSADGSRGKGNDDDDEEGMPRGQKVQCQQQ